MATAEEVARLLSTKLSELFSREEKRDIPIFKGSSDDINIKDWLREAERVAKKNDWSDKQKLRFFSDRLKGDALEWHLTFIEEEEKTYKDWKKKIVERFRDTADIELLKNKLEFIRQKTNQRMKAYISKVESLYDSIYGRLEANPTGASPNELAVRNNLKKLRDEKKKEILIKGLLPKFKNELYRHMPIDPDYTKFIQALLAVEHGLTLKELNEDQSKNAESRNDSACVAQLEIEFLRKEVEKLTTRDEKSNMSYSDDETKSSIGKSGRESDIDRRNCIDRRGLRSNYDISGDDEDYFETYRKRSRSRSGERNSPNDQLN